MKPAPINDWGMERRGREVVLDGELPSRLDTSTPGWGRFASRIRVMLDGQDVTRRCVGFDTAAGAVTRQQTDAADRIFIDPETDKVAVEHLTGKVRIEWR